MWRGMGSLEIKLGKKGSEQELDECEIYVEKRE